MACEIMGRSPFHFFKADFWRQLEALGGFSYSAYINKLKAISHGLHDSWGLT